MQMVMLVIDNPSLLDEVLDAWQAIDVTGATIVESSGLHRRRATTLGARYSFGLPRVVERVEEGHFTVFVAVAQADLVDACLRVAEGVIGDLDRPDTGMFAAWPLSICKGMSDPALFVEDRE